jgi:hypothetical protein
MSLRRLAETEIKKSLPMGSSWRKPAEPPSMREARLSRVKDHFFINPLTLGANSGIVLID